MQASTQSACLRESPTPWPWAMAKVNDMAPPTTRVSTLSRRALMTPSLSLTLAPPRMATNGRAGLSSRPPRTSTSLARRRPAALGQALRGADDRRVGPVGRPEGVVHVQVEALDQLVDEGGVVGLLARVEAEVLEQLDARRQLGQPLPHRRHRVALVGLALGPAEVGAGHDGRPVLLQPLDRGQGGPNPQVVVDLPVRDRNIEVGAEKDPLPRGIRQVFQRGDVQGAHFGRGFQCRRLRTAPKAPSRAAGHEALQPRVAGSAGRPRSLQLAEQPPVATAKANGSPRPTMTARSARRLE